MIRENPFTVGMRVTYVSSHPEIKDEKGTITRIKSVETKEESFYKQSVEVKFTAFVEWDDNEFDNDWYHRSQLVIH